MKLIIIGLCVSLILIEISFLGYNMSKVNINKSKIVRMLMKRLAKKGNLHLLLGEIEDNKIKIENKKNSTELADMISVDHYLQEYGELIQLIDKEYSSNKEWYDKVNYKSYYKTIRKNIKKLHKLSKKSL